MPTDISMNHIYEAGGKSGNPAQSFDLSLGFVGPALTDPSIDGSVTQGAIAHYAGLNDFITSPTEISMGDLIGFYTWGDIFFQYNANLNSDPGGVVGSIYDGYVNSIPIGQAGIGVVYLSPTFSETNVSQGSIAYCRSLGASSRIGVATVNAGEQYKLPPSSSGDPWWMALWMKPTIPGAARNFMWNDMDAENDFNPYRGIGASMQTTGQIRWNRGDGGGTTSSDRYTFGTSATLPSGEWALVILQFIGSGGNRNVISTSTNYAYCYVYNSRTGSWGWTNGASYISGTGVDIAISGPGGSTYTNNMWLNPSGTAGTGLVWEMGSMYWGKGSLASTYDNIRYNTDIYTA